MTKETLQVYRSQEAQRAQASPEPEPARFDAYRSTLRLLVGLALVGGDDLVARLRAWEIAYPAESAEMAEEPEPESASDVTRRALIGMVFEGAETVRQVVSGAAGLSVSFTGAMWSILQPVTESFLFRPWRAPLRALAARGEDRFERFTRIGRAEEPRSRKMADEVTGLLIEDVVDYVEDNRGVRALIDTHVARLLPGLVNDPTIQALLVEQLGTWIAGLTTRAETLDPLVREVGDRYIAYLNEHPGDVQNLVQGQAVGMATEVRDGVRTITVTGDTVLETFPRGLLRRKPREDLPPPPPAVQQPAENGRATSELPQPGEGAQ